MTPAGKSRPALEAVKAIEEKVCAMGRLQSEVNALVDAHQLPMGRLRLLDLGRMLADCHEVFSEAERGAL